MALVLFFYKQKSGLNYGSRSEIYFYTCKTHTRVVIDWVYRDFCFVIVLPEKIVIFS